MKSIILGQLIAYNAFALNPADCLAKSSTEGSPMTYWDFEFWMP